MTIEEAVKFAVHAKHMTDIQEVKEFYSLAEGALRNQMIFCKHCDFSRDSDNRCMCDKSQWAGLPVKPDNYCRCFLPRNEPLTLDALRQMAGRSVWWDWYGGYCLCKNGYVVTNNGTFSFDFVVNNGNVYRCKPKEDESCRT